MRYAALLLLIGCGGGEGAPDAYSLPRCKEARAQVAMSVMSRDRLAMLQRGLTDPEVDYAALVDDRIREFVAERPECFKP